MDIHLTLPDWADERNIYVFAGIEEVAHRLANEGKWKIKAARCSKCGACCLNVNPDWPFGRDPNTKACARLRYDEGARGYLCSLGSNRPHDCCTGWGPEDVCTIRWAESETY